MITVIAVVVAVILVAAASIHFFWAAGGTFGMADAIPSLDGVAVFRPGALATAAVGLVLLGAATLAAAVAGLVPNIEPNVGLRYTAALLAFVFGLRAIGDFRYVGFFKSVTGSRFARLDSLLYSPLCLLLAALIGVMSTRGGR